MLSEEDLVSRMRYLLSNSTKENLVTHPTRWPGAHCAGALCTGKPDVGAWVNRTELRQMRTAGPRNRRDATEADATTHYRVQLDKLPCWSHLSDTQYPQTLSQMCHDIAEQAAELRQVTGCGVAGKKRLLRISAHHRPEHLDKSPAPPIHCTEAPLRQWFIDAYKAFVESYRMAYEALHEGLRRYAFPDGGVPPTSRRCAGAG